MVSVANNVLMFLVHLSVAVVMDMSWVQTGSPARVSHSYNGATFPGSICYLK